MVPPRLAAAAAALSSFDLSPGVKVNSKRNARTKFPFRKALRILTAQNNCPQDPDVTSCRLPGCAGPGGGAASRSFRKDGLSVLSADPNPDLAPAGSAAAGSVCLCRPVPKAPAPAARGRTSQHTVTAQCVLRAELVPGNHGHRPPPPPPAVSVVRLFSAAATPGRGASVPPAPTMASCRPMLPTVTPPEKKMQGSQERM